MNKPIKNRNINRNKKNLPMNKTARLDGFTSEFYQKFRENLTPILFQFLQEIEEEGRLPKSFYESIITLIPKPEKAATKREN